MKKNKGKRLAGAVCLCVLLLGAAGCGDGQTASSAVSESDGDLYSVPPALNVDIASLLTVEQVSGALGTQVGEPQVYEDGTWVNYASSDGRVTVDIHMNETTKAAFDANVQEMRESFPDAVKDAPNLGDAAFFNETTKELMVYAEGYMIDIVVDLGEENQDSEVLQTARSLAALILERL